MYPTAAERLVTAIPASFESVEEAARFLVALADGGADGPPRDGLGFEASEDLFEAGGEEADVVNVVDDDDDDVPLDVTTSLNEKGLVRVLKRVAASLVSPSPRNDRADVRAAATMAHEMALLAFPKLRLFQPKPKHRPPRFPAFYRTTPPKPPAPPATWRAKTTRNVDDVPEDDTSDDLCGVNGLNGAYARLASKKEKAVKILPRHVALPERWRFVDEKHPSFPEDAPPLGLIALKERMRRCVEGAPAEEEASRASEMHEAETTAIAASRAVDRAEEDVRTAQAAKRDALDALEAAEAAARLAEEEDAVAARFAGVARATSHDERHAMTKTFETTQGERAAAKAEVERARAEYAAKTLAASVMQSVLSKERAALVEAESSAASLRDAPATEPRGPWTLDDFSNATAAAAALDADPRVGPPPLLFAGLKFVVALLGGLDAAEAAFATPPYAPEPAGSADETSEGLEETDAGKENLRVGADASATAGAPPSREALERHRIKHEARMWNDPEGLVRPALAASGEKSLASRMRAFVDEALWDFDPAEAEAAKALFLTRAYVKDAEAESALAGRLLKWAYSACRHCDVLAAKARRKEAKKKRESRP